MATQKYLTIQVRIANQYGNERIFPVCNNAYLFCKIAGSITLTRNNIDHIKALGYTVEVIQDIKQL